MPSAAALWLILTSSVTTAANDPGGGGGGEMEGGMSLLLYQLCCMPCQRLIAFRRPETACALGLSQSALQVFEPCLASVWQHVISLCKAGAEWHWWQQLVWVPSTCHSWAGNHACLMQL